MDKTRVIIRADGNALIGLGHVVRCLALAEMLRNEFHCVFVIQEPSPALQEQIMAVCEEVHVLPVSSDYQEEAHFMATSVLKSSDIVVLDNYAFTTEYQRKIISTGCKLVCIDDLADRHYLAHMVINHSGGIEASDFSAEAYTQILIGPNYALLRPIFLAAAKQCTKIEKNNNVFINFGGADPSNFTLKTLQHIRLQPELSITHVVVGSAYQHLAQLYREIDDFRTKVEVHSNVNAERMLELMLMCNYAITSPSSVAYEYLCTGGNLFMELTADNQKRMFQYSIKMNWAGELSDFSFTPKTRNSPKPLLAQNLLLSKFQEINEAII